MCNKNLPQMALIYLKKEPRCSSSPTISLKKFVGGYFNQLYIELNSLLSNYRSIQEHTHRNKIIEFTERKARDIGLLRMIVKGAYLQMNLKLCIAKQEDYVDQGRRIVEIADFLAGMFENMKMSFVPPPNFSLALQAALCPERLLVQRWSGTVESAEAEAKLTEPTASQQLCNAALYSEGTAALQPLDFNEINRLIKIYLLKESIGNYGIVDGVLQMHSKDFMFELTLCGDFKDPGWKLIGVSSHSGSSTVANMLLHRLPSSVRGIAAFIRFYESRKNAHDVFTALQGAADGFYLNFSATVDGQTIRGGVQNSHFVCKITKDNQEIILRDKGKDECIGALRQLSIHHVDPEDALYIKNHSIEVFGENFTFLVGNLCLVFSKKDQCCKIATQNSPGCLVHTVHLELKGDHFVGIVDPHRLPQPIIDNLQYIQLIQKFTKQNYELFHIFYKVLEFVEAATIDHVIATNDFQIDASCRIRYHTSPIHDDDASITEDLSGSDCHKLVLKAMLIYIQRHVPEGFAIVDNKIGEKLILEISKIEIMITTYIKTPLKLLTEDCRHFNILEGLSFIRKFGFFYKYNLPPSSFTNAQLVFNFIELTGENIVITYNAPSYHISGGNTLKLLQIKNNFVEDDYHAIDMLHRAHIINRFSYIKSLVGPSGGDKSTIYLHNGAKIVLTPEKLLFYRSDGASDDSVNQVLNCERTFLSCLKHRGAAQADTHTE